MRLVTSDFGNLAFSFCEMSEQTGSASKTKYRLLPAQESGSLNISRLTTNQNLPQL
jgi:hypothetical protein